MQEENFACGEASVKKAIVLFILSLGFQFFPEVVFFFVVVVSVFV